MNLVVEGFVHNMDGSVSLGTANARNRVGNIKDVIDGKVRIASWDTDVENA